MRCVRHSHLQPQCAAGEGAGGGTTPYEIEGVLSTVHNPQQYPGAHVQVKLTGGRVPVLELCVIRSSISLCTSLSVGKASKIKPLFGHR